MNFAVYIFALCLFSFGLSLSQNARAEEPLAPGVTCSDGLQSKTPLFNTALTSIYSIEYVRKAVEDLRSTYPNALFCVSGLAVSRNNYAYPKYFVQISVVSSGAVVNKMDLLYQDASIQALHNVGDKPWIGLPEEKTDSYLAAFVTSQSLQALAGGPATFDVSAIAQGSSTYQRGADSIDTATFSVMPVAVQGENRDFYIASWLTRLGNNPFTEPVLLKGVLIVRDRSSGQVSIAEGLWLTGKLFDPIESDLLEGVQVPASERVGRLIGVGDKTMTMK